MSGSTFHQLVLGLSGRGVWCHPAAGNNPLQCVEADVAARYPTVQHLSPDRLSADLAGTVLFDVRTAAEFAVSHIPGAIRLDPKLGAAEFCKFHAPLVAGRDVVVYCAVGVRSARLASRLQVVMSHGGARTVANLSGGIIRWHNERRPLIDVRGSTSAVHPFNRHWARFVLRRA
jgi:rhodanese-related sulfurtransferase